MESLKRQKIKRTENVAGKHFPAMQLQKFSLQGIYALHLINWTEYISNAPIRELVVLNSAGRKLLPPVKKFKAKKTYVELELSRRTLS